MLQISTEYLKTLYISFQVAPDGENILLKSQTFDKIRKQVKHFSGTIITMSTMSTTMSTIKNNSRA